MRHVSRFVTAGVLILSGAAFAQDQPKSVPDRPNSGEIPLPVIHTSMKAMPGPEALPSRPAMPDALTLNDGKKVRTAISPSTRRA